MPVLHHGRFGYNMKVVILAGGMGSRISEESQLKPKPMIEVGNRPLLWHIMKIYSTYGFNDFIICCGYKGHMIKEYFVNYHMYQSDNTFYLKETSQHENSIMAEPWCITLANTGLQTLTAGRILGVKQYIGDDDTFLLTYGDGVADVNIKESIEFHRSHGRFATITSTQPEGRFGALKINHDMQLVESFKEKARKDQAWVNAGFMVLNKEIFSYLGDGSEMLEAGPFEKLAEDKQMAAYKHNGFWSPMDTMRDKTYLEELWESGHAPWKIWN